VADIATGAKKRLLILQIKQTAKSRICTSNLTVSSAADLRPTSSNATLYCIPNLLLEIGRRQQRLYWRACSLPFANVFIKDACTGTTTDIDGYYSLEIPENADILVVSYTGYEDAEVALTSTQNTDVNVVMRGGYILGEICVGTIVISDYSYVQDAPRGRTLPQLIGSWIYNNITRKRRWRKSQTHQKVTSVKTESPIIESESSNIRLPQIIAKKLITNIFPNPFDNKIHITLESEAVETLRLVVYDAMSREIHTEQINVLIGTNEIDLNLKERQLTNGSYFVSIFRGDEVIQTEILMRIE